MAIAAVIVLGLLGLIAAAIVDHVRGDGASAGPGTKAAPSLEPVAPSRPGDDAEAAAAHAHRFYRLVVERQLVKAAALAEGEARDQVLALDAHGQVRGDPELAGVLEESLRGRLEDFQLLEPARATGAATFELEARTLVYIGEAPRQIRVWFALRKQLGGWRVERYRPIPETSP